MKTHVLWTPSHKAMYCCVCVCGGRAEQIPSNVKSGEAGEDVPSLCASSVSVSRDILMRNLRGCVLERPGMARYWQQGCGDGS